MLRQLLKRRHKRHPRSQQLLKRQRKLIKRPPKLLKEMQQVVASQGDAASGSFSPERTAPAA